MSVRCTMTKERLEKLRSLKREIERTKKRIELLKSDGTKTLKSAKRLKKICDILEYYVDEASKEAKALLEYIMGIEDSTIREIFMLRYYDGIGSWQKIAFEMGEYDESLVRRRHNAYLKKTK